MELLDGESLAAKLRRGPMTETEALPVLRQMAAGLAAAHSAGVIHRDFKSSNVMLVPKPEELGGLRAVITDFGLAHTSKEGEGSETDLTGDGATVGTPAYMAPSNSKAVQSPPQQTSTPSARFCTKWSRANPRSPDPPRWRQWSKGCNTKLHRRGSTYPVSAGSGKKPSCAA